MSSTNECSFEFGYNYTYDINHLPLMVLMKNEKLTYLRNKPQQYIIDHHIVFDKIVMPKV